MYDATRFVTFTLGGERYALDSCHVKELVMPSRIHRFPHTMRSLPGVLLRRGVVVPVCDLYQAFGETGEPALYIVAQCNFAGHIETIAIPVCGSCELVQGSPSAPVDEVTFVAGLLRMGSQTLPLLDLDQVVAHCMDPALAPARGEAGR